jgi:plastocyanin
MSTKVKDFELLEQNDERDGNLSNRIPKKRRFFPRPLSPFSKAFITVLLIHATLFAGLGLGVHVPAALVISGIELVIAALVLFGVRWVPILGGVFGAMMLYVFIATTGFPVHHLTHPKDAFGYGVFPALSFLMYIVITGLFWCSAMLIITGVAAVTHNYFFSRWRTIPWFKAALTGVFCIWFGAILVGALVQPDQPITALGPTTVVLNVGSFSQSSMSLTKGQSLTLVDSGAYHHNLSMGQWVSGAPLVQNQPGAPTLVNKDVNAAGATVILGPFTTAGTFYLICTLHHNMQLKIIVT